VTRNGGGTAFESPDGQSLYYIKGRWQGSLWKRPVGGGEESQVLPSVYYRDFSLVNEGIYFIPEVGADGKSSLQFLSFATGKVKTVAPISGSPTHGLTVSPQPGPRAARPGSISGIPTYGLTVSPDGRSLLFSRRDEVVSDLMLVENFR
jgi:hypothetical protein